MNSLIWSLMELVKAGGQAGAQFDETVPATYKVLYKAIKALCAGNFTTVNAANSPLNLTFDHAGVVVLDATAGNISAVLPAANVTAEPLQFEFIRGDATTNTAGVTCAGADTLLGGGTSFSLTGIGAQRSIRSNKVSVWITPSALPGPPAGEIFYTAKTTAPAGSLKANGALVSRTTYAALFAAIGTAFGVGDGATTFALPDLRGEFLRGWDDGRGVDSGRAVQSAQLDAFQGHWHTLYRDSSDTPTGGTGLTFGVSNTLTGSDNAVRAPISDGTNGTPRIATETRPRNIALLACIKY
ncbi:MAG: hypothetical protein B7X88_22450 [Polaromonas sp. 17-63-33]|nr:MAG: hypothetical protein B7Y09_21985 [Polaromonas sp. 24-63-21]OZA47392.1 MAG: hypothetical protein B7X88_22450 [Polaromonas sp. 17-63-33]